YTEPTESMERNPLTIQTVCTQIQSDDITRAVRVLHDGGIVAFPTDTVYGVGAHAFLPQAVEKLYVAKVRPRDKAIPVLISGVDMLTQVAASIPEIAYELAAHFWPGALTVVLPRHAKISSTVTSGSDTVAVRVPDHPLTQALLATLDAPLAATSANLSGQPAPITAQEVLAQLDGRIELLLDGGTCPGGVASTVLDLTVSPPQVLRAGSLLPTLESWL
ncbi:MAG: threonylcarbamoyl-AMP synthase, partial [Anaerolineae bacterium]|nr:threonylcarbamoyl-AMP synthase [Anaerolineae bacterium]